MAIQSSLSPALVAFDFPHALIDGHDEITITAVSSIVPFVSAVIGRLHGTLIVCATEREAENIAAVLTQSLGISADFFPAWETFPYERLSPAPDTVGQRHRVLNSLAQGSVIITTIRAVMQPIIIPTPVSQCTLSVGKEIDFEQCKISLISMGYDSVDLVSRSGEIAYRGGIIDIFPTTSSYPVRCEFFGDEISEIRAFSVTDQRSIEGENITTITIYPARELILTDEIITAAQALCRSNSLSEYGKELVDKLAQGIYTPGVESLASALKGYCSFPLLTELIPDDFSIIFVDIEKIHRRSDDILTASEEFFHAAWINAVSGSEGSSQSFPVDHGVLLNLSEITQRLSQGSLQRPVINISAFDNSCSSYTVPVNQAPTPKGSPQELSQLADIWRKQLASGWTVAIVVGSEFASIRVMSALKELELPAIRQEKLDTNCASVQVIIAALISGWTNDTAKITLITDYEFTGVNDTRYSGKQTRKTKAVAHKRIDPLSLSQGDLVVHDHHGIGKFIELTQRTLSGAVREYIVLEYASNKRSGAPDRLYVPMESLDLLSRYVGGNASSLSKLGGSDWQHTKRAARKAVRDIADKLVKLYAQRQSARGFAFSPDTPWQKEFEDKFPYTETSDQLAAIEDIKLDMEKAVPMDRVIVGDVGYGKTEVAMRAAFKAVQDGKQVAVLVPTTLLAGQHLATFTERMQGFPIKIAGLSRFTDGREAKKNITAIAQGEVDIVIGTHRLLQVGISWKDLGLVIVDEEQRFGVEHKEYITSLRTHVDMLTLSATPIPRTLEMSLSGIREMSTIFTPPVDRHPVLTYVGSYDDKQVAAAISRELLRDGQVFYVHNRVASIDATASRIRELVPEAKVAIAHGQMSEELLERTVEGFWQREYDVLVCTTIVETGLDISNANTLIVENSQNLGLSQLHQLRGRVGRSRERAYAYFLYPLDKSLTQTAYDRLATISYNNDLGAGMAVAMKDLEIRGAGNVLGAEQSGHIAGVGFDLYVRLVSEAVQAYRNVIDGTTVRTVESVDTRLDIPVDAHIPNKYISSERLRLSAYKTLAVAKSTTDLKIALDELIDRYGPPPEPVKLLLSLAQLRLLCQGYGVHDISIAGVMAKISPIELLDSAQIRLKRVYPKVIYRTVTQTLSIPLPRTAGLGSAIIRDGKVMQFIADVLAVIASKPQGSVIIGDFIDTCDSDTKINGVHSTANLYPVDDTVAPKRTAFRQ